jgi:hypothetical protein
MIALKSDCLLFQLNNGESIPCSAAMISVEIVGEATNSPDAEMLRHAAASVFHYFKVELDRESVTVGEFSLALEKVLQHLGYTIHTGAPASEDVSQADLGCLAREAGDSLELFFFPRLRDELHHRLRKSPRVLHFSGLRGCVKQIARARRWSPRCEKIQDQIVEFLRECMNHETEKSGCALVVE